MTATVLRLEYDPNRSANIALVEYEDGERRYILAPVGLAAGDKVLSAREQQRGLFLQICSCFLSLLTSRSDA